MCNEWRDNIWLILELVVVSVAMVVVMMNVVCNIELKTRPMGIGPVDDIYVASYSELNEESPGYVDYGERKAEFISRDIRRVTAALRRNQYVEKAGLVQNGIPFTLNYIGNYREFVVNGDSLRYFSICGRCRPRRLKFSVSKAAAVFQRLMSRRPLSAGKWLFPIMCSERRRSPTMSDDSSVRTMCRKQKMV